MTGVRLHCPSAGMTGYWDIQSLCRCQDRGISDLRLGPFILLCLRVSREDICKPKELWRPGVGSGQPVRSYGWEGVGEWRPMEGRWNPDSWTGCHCAVKVPESAGAVIANSTNCPTERFKKLVVRSSPSPFPCAPQ